MKSISFIPFSCSIATLSAEIPLIFLDSPFAAA